MKKYALVLVVVFVAMLLVGCANNNGGINTINDEFDLGKLNQAVYEIKLAANEEFICLEGNNIADGDYEYLDGIIIIKKEYLSQLESGKYSFAVLTTGSSKTLSVNVKAPLRKYNIINGDFETGDLFGWEVTTVFKGEDALQSFVNDGIRQNATFFTFDAPYNGNGRYVYGFDDRDGVNKDRWNERMGLMRSSVFELGGSGFISFMLGGGKNNELCYMSVRNAENDYEIARYGNQLFNSTSYTTDPSNYFEANLVKYKADLTSYIGQQLYVEFVDMGGRDWDLLTIDNVVTYNESQPQDAVLATDIKPTFAPHYVTNQVPNGDFSNGLDGWTVSTSKGFSNSVANNTFWVDNGTLKSNLNGNGSRGLIRSSLFRVDGCGVISLKIGAAQGARYDKDTYVSIKERYTNRELIRFANRNHNGNEMIEYYVDLSDYMGKECYIEIVDNAKSDYDTIFVKDVVTYYSDLPAFDYGQVAINLNK